MNWEAISTRADGLRTRGTDLQKRIRGLRRRLTLLLAVVGPGLITSNVDNDAGGISVYTQAGAQYGYALLWSLIPMTIALYVTEEMCARMGVITGKGLSDLIREEFGFRPTFFVMVTCFFVDLANEEASDHHKKRWPETELLADQVGESFAGDDAHARAHLFGDVQRDGHGNQRPQQRVAILRAGLRIRRDAAGVVVHVGGNEARADDREQQGQTAAQAANLLLQILAARLQALEGRSYGSPVHSSLPMPSLIFHQPRNYIIDGYSADGVILLIHDRQHSQIVFVE